VGIVDHRRKKLSNLFHSLLLLVKVRMLLNDAVADFICFLLIL